MAAWQPFAYGDVMTEILTGPCDRLRYLKGCECDQCHGWSLIRMPCSPEGSLAVAGIIAAIYAWQSLAAQDAIWELVWQIKRALGSGVSAEDVHHDLVLLFRGGKP